MAHAAGIGGDAFCLFFSAATREVTAMLGCGRSPAGLTMEVGWLLLSMMDLYLSPIQMNWSCSLQTQCTLGR